MEACSAEQIVDGRIGGVWITVKVLLIVFNTVKLMAKQTQIRRQIQKVMLFECLFSHKVDGY